MSLHQSGKSFIPIWRIYKVLHFINLKDQLNAYKVMCNFILNDDFREDAFRVFDTIDGIRFLLNNDWELANHSASHYPITEDSYINKMKIEVERGISENEKI